jgi:GT2 family glycosyltransferase
MDSQSRLVVSVVIPTFRRPKLLDRCLSAVLAQDIEPSHFEVIVCDDAEDGATYRQVACWQTRAAVRGTTMRYIPVRGVHGPAAARNAGWRVAQGEIIAFTDDDCVPAAAWLRAGLAVIGAGNADARGSGCDEYVETIDGVSGRVVVPLTQTPTDYERNEARLAHADFVTANCFYRRDALAAVGGFDEHYTLAWREDSDLQFRLLDRGARLVTSTEAIVLHPVRPAPWGVSITQQRKSMFNALLYKQHPRRYRASIQPRPPWRYYATVGALIGGATGLFIGRRRLAWLSLSAWAALTIAFCARRLDGTSHAPSHVIEMLATSIVIPPLAVFWRLRGALKFRIWFL